MNNSWTKEWIFTSRTINLANCEHVWLIRIPFTAVMIHKVFISALGSKAKLFKKKYCVAWSFDSIRVSFVSPYHCKQLILICKSYYASEQKVKFLNNIQASARSNLRMVICSETFSYYFDFEWFYIDYIDIFRQLSFLFETYSEKGFYDRFTVIYTI